MAERIRLGRICICGKRFIPTSKGSKLCSICFRNAQLRGRATRLRILSLNNENCIVALKGHERN